MVSSSKSTNSSSTSFFSQEEVKVSVLNEGDVDHESSVDQFAFLNFISLCHSSQKY